MAEKIKLVSGDTGPQIRLTLTDETTGLPIDLTGAAVTLHFRAVGDTTVLFSRLLYVAPDTAANGIALVNWGSTDLNQPAGDYEGEIEIVFADAVRQTMYDPLKFKLREDYA